MTYIVGLTGGIGSGKTVVSDHFATLGVPVIDTDIIARKIVEPGQATLDKLSQTFGADILTKTGELDRDALRKIAFANAQNKQRLDSITHPAIRTETIRQIEAINYAYCIVVVPLLHKNSPFITLMDAVIAVTAEKETRIKRVMQRSQLSRSETLKIMDTQISDQQRTEFANDIIQNDGTIKQAQHATDKLHKQYLSQSTAQ